MRKVGIAVAAASVFAMTADVANAATTTVVGTSSGAVSGDGSVTVTLDQFNAALGTLNSVSFSVFSGTSSATITITNDGGTTESSSVKLNSALYITDNDGVLASLLPAAQPYSTFDSTGDISLNGGESSDPQSLETSASAGLNFLVSAGSPSLFVGSDTFSFTFTFDTGFETETGSNFSVSGSSLSNAAVSIVYDYTPTVSSGPLPAALPMLGAGLAGIAFVARRRKAA